MYLAKLIKPIGVQGDQDCTWAFLFGGDLEYADEVHALQERFERAQGRL